ncbi:MAG: type II toxin-antitoxin system RelE/ParE family toxin [Sulfuricaulis sp.]
MPWTLRSAVTSTRRPRCLRALAARGVLEIVEDGRGGTCRAVYTVKFEEAVFVCCMCSRKRAGRVLQHPNRTWTLSANA